MQCYAGDETTYGFRRMDHMSVDALDMMAARARRIGGSRMSIDDSMTLMFYVCSSVGKYFLELSRFAPPSACPRFW